MTHVIRFPAPTIPYPGRSTELETPEYVLLTAIRLWVDDHRRGVDALLRLSEALSVAGVQDAAFAIDQLMAIVARTALLFAHRAECTLGPLQGLAELFDEARLLLRRQAPEALETVH